MGQKASSSNTDGLQAEDDTAASSACSAGGCVAGGGWIFCRTSVPSSDTMPGQKNSDEVRQRSSVEELDKMKAIISQDCYALRAASSEVRGDCEVVLSAVRQDGRALSYAADGPRDDHEVVLAAVSQDGIALASASEKMRADREIVVAAVEKNGNSLAYASKQLRADRDVVLAAVRSDGASLKHAGRVPRSEKDIVLAAVHKDGLALRFASEELRASREVVLRAVEQDAWALQYGSELLRANRRVVTQAVIHNGQVLQYASERLRADRLIVLTAVKHDGRALEYAAERLRGDREVVLQAIVTSGHSVLYWASEGVARELGKLTQATAAAMLEVAREIECPDDVEGHDFDFLVKFCKGPNAKIGLNIKVMGEDRSWGVIEVGNGLIQDWNSIHAGSILEVIKGDFILEINSVSRDSRAMIEALHAGGDVELKVRRKANPNSGSPRRAAAEATALAAAAAAAMSGEDEEGLVARPAGKCVICLDEPPSITFVHGATGHFACCAGCAAGLPLRWGTCPICRQPYSAMIQTYFV